MTESSSTPDLDSETNQDFIALNKKNDELTRKLDELTFEMKQIKDGKRLSFVHVPNKWKLDDSQWSQCCENNCVNTDRPDVYCIKGNGFIQIKSDTNIKYINCRNEIATNKATRILAENSFNKPNENSTLSQCCLHCTTFTLFYYEVKIQLQKVGLIALILRGDNFSVALWPDKRICYCFQNEEHNIKLDSFSIENEDIIGCGIVYPPPNINNKLPYVFFTQNGQQIGKAILMEENYEFFEACIIQKLCSIETNFGDDLTSKPFLYDISKHYVAEEFYQKKDYISEEDYIYDLKFLIKNKK